MAAPSSAQKEWFSRAFLIAISAAAGYPAELMLNDVNGVDATVWDGGVSVDWQLKGTSSPNFHGDREHLCFDLDVRTYSLFTGVRTSTGYLCVVVLPRPLTSWINLTLAEMTLRRCAYWVKVTGLPPTSNAARVRVKIPLANRLCVDDIRAIMAAERERVSS